MIKRRKYASPDLATFSVRLGFEPVAFNKLLTLDGASDTLMGGPAPSGTDTSQTGDAKSAGEQPTGDAKPADQQTPATGDAGKTGETTDTTKADAVKEGEDGAGKVAPKAPEKYEFTMPEGVALDAEFLGEFEGIARELDLPQESAQKLADLGVKLQQKFVATQTEALDKAAAGWLEASKADPEFGGDNLGQNIAIAQKARDTFASPALREMLHAAKLTDHPEVIRLFVKIGKAISEDRMVNGGSGNSADKPAANVLYPNQK